MLLPEADRVLYAALVRLEDVDKATQLGHDVTIVAQVAARVERIVRDVGVANVLCAARWIAKEAAALVPPEGAEPRRLVKGRKGVQVGLCRAGGEPFGHVCTNGAHVKNITEFVWRLPSTFKFFRLTLLATPYDGLG